jgi:hypothetical protein
VRAANARQADAVCGLIDAIGAVVRSTLFAVCGSGLSDF